jgi:hypothetical protein
MVSGLFRLKPMTWPKWVATALAFCVIVFMVGRSHLDDANPQRHVYAFGLPIDFGPYQADAGCPQRTWSVDEFLPAACVKDNIVSARRARLERANDHGTKGGIFYPRRMAWVRVNGDAVLIARAFPEMGGMIVQVERHRFHAATAASPPQTDAAPPPLLYWLGYGFALLVHIVFLAMFLVALWVRAPWRRAPDDSAEQPELVSA